MIGYRATERQIKWAERSSRAGRVISVIYVVGWVYIVGRTWLVDDQPQEALKSFLFGLVFLSALLFADRRLSDFRRR